MYPRHQLKPKEEPRALRRSSISLYISSLPAPTLVTSGRMSRDDERFGFAPVHTWLDILIYLAGAIERAHGRGRVASA